MTDIIGEALEVEAAFRQAMDLAEGPSNDNHGGIKWAMVCCINRLRDEGASEQDSIKTAMECLREVCGFIAELDDMPDPTKPVH